MTAAEKLDYSVSRSAAALKSGQSFRIALLASETITTWFNANIFAGLDSALRPSGYDTVPYPMRNAAERHDFFADLPVRRNADAVIVSSFDIEPAEVERLKHMHVPIVGINIPSTDGFDAGVSIDDYAATRSAIEHPDCTRPPGISRSSAAHRPKPICATVPRLVCRASLMPLPPIRGSS